MATLNSISYVFMLALLIGIPALMVLELVMKSKRTWVVVLRSFIAGLLGITRQR